MLIFLIYSRQGSSSWPLQIEVGQRRKKVWPYVRATRAGDPNQPENRVTAHLQVDKLIVKCAADQELNKMSCIQTNEITSVLHQRKSTF